MSLSPANILQRLQELKKWQENHEIQLKKTKNLINTNEDLNNSDYDTIAGLSAFDSSINQSKINWESQTISPTKSFNELLEEKLKLDPGPIKIDANKPKKPFLKKGTGLQRFRMTPGQKPRLKTRKKVKINEGKITPLKAPDFVVKPKATWSKIDNEQENTLKSQLSEQTLYEKALEKELLIFEALEERAENSSFCSTNSSVLQILASTPSKLNKINKQPPILEEKRVHWESQSDDDEDVIETNLDIGQILLRLKNLTNNSTVETSEEDKSSISSRESSISSTDLEITLKGTCDVAVGTTDDNSRDCPMCQGKLDNKIKEYEEKINEVIKDKNKITQIRTELEGKKEMLEKEFNKMKKEFEDEKRNILFDLENEKKKLIKEKMVFQTHLKDSQNRPNKKEREEISNLKQELADLKEILKLKESKNGMTQARLRNQIKQLEKDNSNLKDEVEKLTKENAKLTAMQKINKKSSENKILQEINKNVTKLAQKSEKSPKKIEEKIVKEDSLLEMEKAQNSDLTEIEKLYENTFRKENPGKIETVQDDNTKIIKYPIGNIKTISPDGNLIKINYFNGDIQETNLIDGTIRYFFYTKKIWQTTYADGLEIVEFPDGIKEKRYVDGKCEIILPDDVVQVTFSDGSQETKYPDGSVVHIKSNGDKILLLPNGQKEIETKECKKREYPDGTVKILYPDGTQETKYSNGRIRIKDKNASKAIVSSCYFDTFSSSKS